MNENRKNNRYVVDFQTGVKSDLVFLYELADDSIGTGDQDHREGVATMHNISINGCYIHCYGSFPLETRLFITIIPVVFPNHKIFATGIVVRQNPDERYGYYYGIQFIEYNEGSKATLDKFIDHLSAAESLRGTVPN